LKRYVTQQRGVWLLLHCLLFSTCSADSQQDIAKYCTHTSVSLRACAVALSQTSVNKRNDFYLMASLWDITTHVKTSLTTSEQIIHLIYIYIYIYSGQIQRSLEQRKLPRIPGFNKNCNFCQNIFLAVRVCESNRVLSKEKRRRR